MGYRYHLSIVDKEKARAMAIRKEETFLPDIPDKHSDDYMEALSEKTAFYDLVENDLCAVDDFDLGQISLPEEVNLHTSRFFSDDQTALLFEHYEPVLVLNTKPIEAIIEYMRQQVLKDYQECFEDENLRLAKIHRKIQEWTAEFSKPYNLDLENKGIVSSMSLEYEIFELVRFMKSIDWEKQAVIYFGW